MKNSRSIGSLTAKAVMQDIASCEESRETTALLKILAIGSRQVEEGKLAPAADVIRRMRGNKPRS